MGPFNECVDKLIVQLYKLAADKSPVCMMTQFSRTTLDVLSKVLTEKWLNDILHFLNSKNLALLSFEIFFAILSIVRKY